MSRSRAYLLSLGSNVAPQRWIPRALDLLTARFRVDAVSPRYDVAAAGKAQGQARYVNLAVRLRTDLPPRSLRVVCRHIEALCARVREVDRFAARTLDVDVVYDGAAQAALADDLVSAAYVLVPCADLWPDAVLESQGVTLGELAAVRFPGWGATRRVEDD